MKPKEELYRLVQSLNKAEKGYFKKFTGIYSTRGDTHYLQLFELIEGQKEYDEKEIKEAFGDTAFGKFLSANKAYLFRLILKSLRNFYSEISVETQVADMVREVEILFRKGLLDEAGRHAEKALLKAIHQELYYHTLNLYFWRSRIFIARGYAGMDLEKLNAFYSEWKRTSALLSQSVDYDALSSEVYYLVKLWGYPRNEAQEKAFQTLLDSTLLNESNFPPGLRSQIKYFNIKTVLLTVLGRKQEAFELMKPYVELFENNPVFYKENTTSFISCLEKFIFFASENKRYEEMYRYNERLKQLLEEINTPSTADYYLFYLNMLAVYYISTHQFGHTESLRKEIEEKVPQPDGDVDMLKEYTLHVHFCVLLMAKGAWKELFRRTNKLISGSGDEMILQARKMARLLNLVACYELDETDLMKSRIRSYRRESKLNELYFHGEDIALNLFGKLASDIPESEARDCFQKASEMLSALPEAKEPDRGLDYILLPDYFRATALGKNIAELDIKP